MRRTDPREVGRWATRGECIRRFGRAWVEALPRTAWMRQGRRQFIAAWALVEFPPA